MISDKVTVTEGVPIGRDRIAFHKKGHQVPPPVEGRKILEKLEGRQKNPRCLLYSLLDGSDFAFIKPSGQLICTDRVILIILLIL